MGEPPWVLPLITPPSWLLLRQAPPSAPRFVAGPLEGFGPEGPPTFGDPAERYDGHLIGASAHYPPGTPLSQVRGVRPSDGSPVTHTILYVNGIRNSPQAHFDSLQAIADRAGAEVIGVYNATDGWTGDLWQCILDKLDLGRNPAVDSLSGTILSELNRHDGPINLMAHSQGGLITSRALEDVRLSLHESGLSEQQIDARMSRIQVETFGGAAWDYPDGPRYNHHVNVLDPVPNLAGRGTLWGSLLGLLNDGGEGSRTTPIMTTAGATHGFTEAYLPNWTPSFQQGSPRP